MRGFFRECSKQKYLMMMAAPAFLVILIFHYFPIYGIIIAFKDFRITRGIMDSAWVGLKWFKVFFENPLSMRLLRNTVLLGVNSLIWGFPAPIILSLLLNEITNMRFKKMVQTISYLPHFISTIIIVGMLKNFASLDGLFNNISAFFGNERVVFFAMPKYFRTLFVGSSIWQGLGWGTIIYLAAISGIDIEMYESATIDGANRWHKMLHITLPSMIPTITILFILRMGSVLGVDAQKVLLMYNPQTYETADVIGTYVYREGIEGGRFSYTAAVGLFMSVISFLFIYITNCISKKLSDNSLW